MSVLSPKLLYCKDTSLLVFVIRGSCCHNQWCPLLPWRLFLPAENWASKARCRLSAWPLEWCNQSSKLRGLFLCQRWVSIGSPYTTPGDYDSDADSSPNNIENLFPAFHFFTSVLPCRLWQSTMWKKRSNNFFGICTWLKSLETNSWCFFAPFLAPPTTFFYRSEKLDFTDTIKQMLRRWEIPFGDPDHRITIRIDPCKKCHLQHTDCRWRPPLRRDRRNSYHHWEKVTWPGVCVCGPCQKK